MTQRFLKKSFFFQTLIVIIVVAFCSIASAQKEANIWYFGIYAGIDFNKNPPEALTDGQINILEGVATISDKDGNLLFYTEGRTVWSHDHSIMVNGTGLKGHSSSTSSAIIIPWPFNNDKYIVVTVDWNGIQGQAERKIHYSVVDMSLNGALGEVTDKNIFITDYSSEKISATIKSDGSGYWLAVARMPTNYSAEYKIYSIDQNGLNLNPVQTISSPFVPGVPQSLAAPAPMRGYMKFSPDGTKMVAAMGYLEFFDFDDQTGQLSNPRKIAQYFMNQYGYKTHPSYYSFAFSANSSLLYTKSNDQTAIAQFDLSSGDATTISASVIDLPHPNPQIVTGRNGDYVFPSGDYSLTAFQIASNGKIYVGAYNLNFMVEINSPDLLGSACDINWKGLDLKTGFGQSGLPTFIQSTFKSRFFIQADPPTNSTFTTDTSVTLHVFFEGSEIGDANIFYTLDGSSPAGPNRISYTSPVNIDKTLTLRVFVEKTGFESDSASFNYQKLAGKVEKPSESIRIISPASGSNAECFATIQGSTSAAFSSVSLTGSFNESPLLANRLSDTTWSAVVHFPTSSTGSQNILAEADFSGEKATDEIQLLVSTGNLTADFSVEEGSDFATFLFTDQSVPGTEDIVEWTWVFSENERDDSLSGANASHRFSSFGSHQVGLVIRDTGGCEDKRDTTLSLTAPKATRSTFYDMDDNASLDRLVIDFDTEVDTTMKNFFRISLSWPDSTGSIRNWWSDSTPSTSLYPDPDSSTRLIWDFQEDDMAKLVTGTGDGFGQVLFYQGQVAEGIELLDSIAPRITFATLFPSSNGERRPDTLSLVFSEEMDPERAPDDRLFSFLLDGASEELLLPYQRDRWASDKRSAKLHFYRTAAALIPQPGDSVRIQPGEQMLTDRSNNGARPSTPFVRIGGKYFSLIESNVFAVSTADFKEEAFAPLESFHPRKGLEQTAGRLGPVFIPELPAGAEKMQPSELQWSYSLIYYSNIGTFVARTNGKILCTDALFHDNSGQGNCLTNGMKKIFIPWNLRSDAGRRVGTGAYIQKVRISGFKSDLRTVGIIRQ